MTILLNVSVYVVAGVVVIWAAVEIADALASYLIGGE